MSRRTIQVQPIPINPAEIEEIADAPTEAQPLPVWEKILILAMSYDLPEKDTGKMSSHVTCSNKS